MPKIKKSVSKSKVSKSTNRIIFFAGIVVLLAIIGKQVLSTMMNPAGINEIASRTASNSRIDMTYTRPPEGCYYPDIQCITEPCDRVLVCNSPIPSQSMSPRPTIFPSPSLVPSSPIPSPRASTSPACLSKITTLSMNNRCSPTGFLQYSFQCVGGTAMTVNPGNCIDAITIHRMVSERCGLSCNN